MKPIEITLTVNETTHTLITLPNRTLLDILREDLGLTGAKNGCESGECGACTVLMNGAAVNACLVLAGQADGCTVETIEGLSKSGQLHPIQQAFVDAGAVQCGFCIPGMVMASKALLDHNPQPQEEDIRQALAGNICRCTGYTKIIQAVQMAAEELRHD
ncbi:(2Fe-2S)-binding protein [Levilinea saccharolytica]|uniref:(2Fe-2S)-binding protein n=1 Tax=Levilinea saccharolytica TaxID=229921 RepID=A0A0M8JPK2_9CHLR|nr:(2Fe-2S)-binding protein [Levilinea saccharolytica]KPL76207.1 (2Fe-2S)-binding protein [Levilinea saccharolytica]GAP19029.1 aerobic-type carbon monoxide dehydrogenase, small subunit CoxS/CutS homologs [Levilinea saccharolytica]